MSSGITLGTEQADLFSRLKSLEERILFLEGLSPEYFSAGVHVSLILHTVTGPFLRCLQKQADTWRFFLCCPVGQLYVGLLKQASDVFLRLISLTVLLF